LALRDLSFLPKAIVIESHFIPVGKIALKNVSRDKNAYIAAVTGQKCNKESGEGDGSLPSLFDNVHISLFLHAQ
jgi:hypothetical protein